MTSFRILFTIALCTLAAVVYGQWNLDSLSEKINPQRWAASIEKKADKLQEKIVAKSLSTLSRMQRREEKIYKKLLKGKDSLEAKASLAQVRQQYEALRHQLNNPSSLTSSASHYIPKLDTLGTALKFLEGQGAGGKVTEALRRTQSLQDRFGQAEEIKKFIGERKRQLKEQLERLGLTRELKRINKEVYYYSAQVNEYKSMLKDSRKAERKALELLGQTKLFKDFMRKNSQLASLFRLPGDAGDPQAAASLSGLQTRAQVNSLIQQQIAAGGAGAQQQMRENLQAAQSQLNQLKNKFSGYGSGSSEDILPEGFRPNDQKTRSLWKRLEYGTNVQTQKATNYFPVTSDIGLSVGYKLNDKSVVGVGASYKMGWGRGWNNIAISSEGVGIRSYMDWKIRGSWWVSGGYEQNYRTAFSDFDQLRDLRAWQQSGLIGMSKVVSMKAKFFKKTKLQLLWDFLSYEQVPRGQPVIFRVGYTLK